MTVSLVRMGDEIPVPSTEKDARHEESSRLVSSSYEEFLLYVRYSGTEKSWLLISSVAVVVPGTGR